VRKVVDWAREDPFAIKATLQHWAESASRQIIRRTIGRINYSSDTLRARRLCGEQARLTARSRQRKTTKAELEQQTFIDKRGERNSLFNLSVSLHKLREVTSAISHAEAALRIFKEIEDPHAEMVRQKVAQWRAGEGD
jgi:hypothetical protein